MTVYVDNMKAAYGRMKMCHMIADTEDELHAMANKIGVAKRWFQGDHYDIALSKRALAVAAGAVEITLRQCAVMAMEVRAGRSMPTLDQVPAIIARRIERMRDNLGLEVRRDLASATSRESGLSAVGGEHPDA